jgi:hypothetical protein
MPDASEEEEQQQQQQHTPTTSSGRRREEEEEDGRMTLLKTLLLLRVPVSDWALDARVYGLFAHTHAFEAWRGDPCALRLRMRRWLHHDLVPLARRTRLFVRRLRFVPTAANVWWRTHLEPWLRDGMPLSDCLCVPILPMDFVRLGRHLWRAKWQQNNALAVSHTADI